MAGGNLVKQDVLLTAPYLNQVNDSVSGGAITALPSGVTGPAYSQTIPGDRIVLDDVTALALSYTTTATLYGGIYEYDGSISGSTASPALGSPAFFRAADIGVIYQVTPDANPTAAVPTFLRGVYLNAVSKGNWGWIQVGGVATVKYQGTVTGTTAGYLVTVGLSQTPPAFDAQVAAWTVVLAANGVGVAIDAPSNAATGRVAMFQSPFRRV
jgi:hypothetical protein